jgi:hypothetical protein
MVVVGLVLCLIALAVMLSALGPDATHSGQSKIYVKQQPAGTTLNGNTVITEEVSDAGSVQNEYGLQALNGQVLPAQIVFTIAPTGGAGSNTVQITAQVVDNGLQPIANFPFDLDVILSDAANGVGVTAVTASGAVTFTAGTVLNTYSAKKAFYVQSDATGKVVFTIVDAAKTGFYCMVQAGSQPLPSVSRQLVAGDYS